MGLMNQTPTLGLIIRYFKAGVTFQINKNGGVSHLFEGKFWQRNYYERIIRDEKELNAYRKYIKMNPENWKKDMNNPLLIKKFV